MRKKIVAGNWKMNLGFKEAVELVQGIESEIKTVNEVEVILFPSIALASSVKEYLCHSKLGIQNVFPASSGAFTGETSLQHAEELGANYLLIGHSERRAIFHESNEFIKQKVDEGLAKGFNIIFCVGEPLEEREKGNEVSYVMEQLNASLFHVSPDLWKQVVVAYEPIWAIGTGLTANAQQAEEIHAAIRSSVISQFGQSIGNELSILYGGSCTPNNAKELFACPNVDGGLIGGAALNATSFSQIIRSI